MVPSSTPSLPSCCRRGPEPAVSGQREAGVAVAVAGPEVDHVGERHIAGLPAAHRLVTVARVALAEIAVRAMAPGPEAAVPAERMEGRRVGRRAPHQVELDHVTARDTGGAADIARIDRARDAVAGGVPAAVLAVAAVAPGDDVAVIGQHSDGTVGTDHIARTAGDRMVGIGAVVPHQVMEVLGVVGVARHGEFVVVVGPAHADGAVGHHEGHVVIGDVAGTTLAWIGGLAVQEPDAALACRQGMGCRRHNAARQIGGNSGVRHQ